MPFHLQNWTKLYFFSIIKKYQQLNSSSGRRMQVSRASFHLPMSLLQCQWRNFKKILSHHNKKNTKAASNWGGFSVYFRKVGGWWSPEEGGSGSREHTQELQWGPTCRPADAQDPRTFHPGGQEWEWGLNGGLIKDQFIEKWVFYLFPLQVCLPRAHTCMHVYVCTQTHRRAHR